MRIVAFIALLPALLWGLGWLFLFLFETLIPDCHFVGVDPVGCTTLALDFTGVLGAVSFYMAWGILFFGAPWMLSWATIFALLGLFRVLSKLRMRRK
ncbi:hypothetical protein J7443_13250 [Tropicibacter sp. R15_0]|uniref:hypothetical protein n=1 Tax=Tropicibacter sp. R15_0 TaxID=2821101 RepID=UPI001ADB95A6|nr:hypothetical protein [Tropicibacter sp. R15_0]MBO9466203.1 hypothetical protein [Tropicibacter sp. R15_0]